jgi:hypothetical protein
VNGALKNGTLVKLNVKNLRLIAAEIMLVQRARTTPRANVDHVRKATIEKLRQL